MINQIDQTLSKYITQLSEAEKKSVLLLLKTFIASRSGNAASINIDQYNKEIDEALAKEENGNYITQEHMEKNAAKW